MFRIINILSIVVMLLVGVSACSNGKCNTNRLPVIVSIIPANGATNVNIESSIYVTFEESDVNPNNIYLYAHLQNSNNLVFTNVTYIGNNTYKIVPLQPLSYSTTYYVSAYYSNNLQSISLQQSNSSKFTTQAMPVGDIWIGGTKLLDQSGIYGDLGVRAPNTQPGSRADGATWTDLLGNLWLFGGESSSGLYLNDMWVYNPYAKVWTWISGSNSSNQSGNYGIQGVSAKTNTPGARGSAMFWTDKNGNLWLFGGYGYDTNGNLGYLSDLWMFNTSNYTWVWISGNSIVNQNGTYGTKGVASTSNLPKARDSGATWVDNNGNFWLFGGCVVTSPSSCDYINDLWKYDTSMNPNQWIWVGGSQNINESSNYGIQGQESFGNIPGARDGAVTWVDKSGNFWLFGGYNKDSSGAWNDLWKYNTTNGMWSWVNGGSDMLNQPGIYGTKGVADANNIPGSREDSISWVDSQGNLWLLGGSGQDVYNHTGTLNDLWRYNITSNSWMWVSGFKVFGIGSNYGTMGVSGGNQVVVSAREGAMSWTDNNGNFWLFAGFGYATQSYSSDPLNLEDPHYLNDLWVIKTQ